MEKIEKKMLEEYLQFQTAHFMTVSDRRSHFCPCECNELRIIQGYLKVGNTQLKRQVELRKKEGQVVAAEILAAVDTGFHIQCRSLLIDRTFIFQRLCFEHKGISRLEQTTARAREAVSSNPHKE